MLEYRINGRNLKKTFEQLQVNEVRFTDLEKLLSDEEEIYNGDKKDKLMVTCKCDDVNRLHNSNFINTANYLTLTFYQNESPIQQTYTFRNDFQISNVDNNENTFDFYIDKYTKLDVVKIVCGYEYANPSYFFEGHDEDNIFLHCKSFHYFDSNDDITEEGKQEIPIYFKYSDTYGRFVTKVIKFRYYDYSTLTTSLSEFVGSEKENESFFKMLFGIDSSYEENGIEYAIVLPKKPDEDSETHPNGLKSTSIEHNGLMYYAWVDKASEYDIDAMQDPQAVIGSLSGVDVYRNTFLFTDKTVYEFNIDAIFTNITVPISNKFETDLFQTELLNEYFVGAEMKKVINRIVDIEKDVYYPCIKLNDSFQDIYTIKFNLHFREHRTNDWITENSSLWNGVEQEFYYINKNDSDDKKRKAEYHLLSEEAKSNYIESDEPVDGTASINNEITNDDVSDLMKFLNFTNEDIHYQKNKLKKSFLRLSFYDSTNPADQNLIGYSTIFFDSGNLFAKYIKHIETKGYKTINFGLNDYGKYSLSYNKRGIRVDREYHMCYYKHKTNETTITEDEYKNLDDTVKQNYVAIYEFDESKRLSSQLVVKDKNTSTSSSEGFYLYIWKDNENTIAQDLYMKVEFNHAGYGRTIPFMMPYWDSKKYKMNNSVVRTKEKGIKSFKEILDDWNAKRIYRKKDDPTTTITEDDYKVLEDDEKQKYYADWSSNTDGHYGIRQYNKYSYIHMKYQYDKENDRHYYYIDTDTYGEQSENKENEIIINLYEAKVE